MKEQCERCEKAVEANIADNDVEWISSSNLTLYPCLRCGMKDKEQANTCKINMGCYASNDEFQHDCKIRHDTMVDCYATQYHVISFVPIFGKLFFTGCPITCTKANDCFCILHDHNTVESLLSYLTESTVPACQNFPNLLVSFAEYKTGKGLPDYTLSACKRIVNKAIARQSNDDTPEIEGKRVACKRCGYTGYLPDGQSCRNCLDIDRFQEQQGREELTKNPKGCDNSECHAEDKLKSPLCEFCEKPITGEPVMRHNMLTGVTTFFHADCVERVDELTAAIKPELHTFESGAVRYSTGKKYDLMSSRAVGLLYGISPCAELIHELLALHTQHDIAVRVSISLYGKLQNFLEKRDSEVLDLYAQALDEGSKKYGDRNWEKGIPESNLVNHAIYHAIKLDAGDTSEDHAAHLVWNVMTIIHFRLLAETSETSNGENDET